MVEEFFRMAGSSNYHELGGQQGGIRQKKEEYIASLKASPPTANVKKKNKESTCRIYLCYHFNLLMFWCKDFTKNRVPSLEKEPKKWKPDLGL